MTFANGIEDAAPNEPQKGIELPQTIIDEFARFLVPEIRKYYASEQGQKEFAKWQEKQAQAYDK